MRNKTDRAMEWIRSRNGNANETSAQEAGFSKSVYYTAKKRLREKGDEKAIVPAEPAQPTLNDISRLLTDRCGPPELHYFDGETEIIIRRRA